MGLNKEVELITIPKKQTSKTSKVKSLNGYDAIREKLDEGTTMTVKNPVMRKGPQPEKPKTKVSIGL
jgi:hypothetical protein